MDMVSKLKEMASKTFGPKCYDAPARGDGIGYLWSIPRPSPLTATRKRLMKIAAKRLRVDTSRFGKFIIVNTWAMPYTGPLDFDPYQTLEAR